MTHGEALASDHLGFPGRSCPGELEQTGRHADVQIDRAGRLVEGEVATYRCPECGRCLAIGSDGVVRNVYQVYATSLAGILALPRVHRAEEA